MSEKQLTFECIECGKLKKGLLQNIAGTRCECGGPILEVPEENKDAGPGIGKKFQENMIDKLLDETKEMPISKETKMVLKEIMTKKTCLKQLDRIINEIETIHRGRPSDKFFFLQASLLFAKKYLEENTFQYSLWDKVRVLEGNFKGRTGRIIEKKLLDCVYMNSISYKLDSIDGFFIEENLLEVVEYA